MRHAGSEPMNQKPKPKRIRWKAKYLELLKQYELLLTKQPVWRRLMQRIRR